MTESMDPIYLSPSEAKAAELYGPPPEGDEEPHAGVAIPDPGETSGPPLYASTEALDALPIGTVVWDKDGDEWTKQRNNFWASHPEGPIFRAKTLVRLWAPFTVKETK